MKSKPGGSNSFVSPGVMFEFEIDIMGILARDGGESVRYAMVAVGNFTKIAEVTPIENRQPIELTSALKLIFKSMGTPKQLYSEEESSFRAKVFFRFMNGTGIKHVQTSTHAPSVERFIRTFKDNLYRRLDGLNQNKIEWVKHVKNIVTKYNNTEHNATKIKPLGAVNKENHLWLIGIYRTVLQRTGNTLRLMKVIWLELTFKKIDSLKVMNRIGVENVIK